MIIGDTQIFALESKILQAYQRRSLRALGSFVIHIAGQCYGSQSEEATMLAASFDGVNRRIARRGAHDASVLSGAAAQELATSFSRAIYIEHHVDELFLGMKDSQFKALLYSNELVWAQDGDEGFDDGSCVLQFDVAGMVRLIAFKRAISPILDPDSLRDVWLTQEDFYGILLGLSR